MIDLWLISIWIDYEGDQPIAIATSEEKAKELLEKIAKTLKIKKYKITKTNEEEIWLSENNQISKKVCSNYYAKKLPIDMLNF